MHKERNQSVEIEVTWMKLILLAKFYLRLPFQKHQQNIICAVTCRT